MKIDSKTKTKINKALYDLTRNRYFDSIPHKDINAIIVDHGGTGLQDGIYCGADGFATEQVGDNLHIAMTWHKMPSGRYEIVAYVS